MIKFIAAIVLFGVVVADPIRKIVPRSGFPDGRIIGGEDTTIEEVPYQVSIAVGGRHSCGGSIVAENWVLTAAHCVQYPINVYSIRAGSSHSHIGGSIHKVDRIIAHKEFVTDNADVPSNDIALMHIATPFKFDTTRQPVQLYASGEKSEIGFPSVITGWGSTNEAYSIEPHQLQAVSVPIISKEECKKDYEKMTHLNPGQICAAYPAGGKDACQGDSGGPLVIEGRLAGIVSWGNGCARPANPGVYTEIAYFRDWITKNMQD